MVDINEIAGLRKRLERLEAFLPMLDEMCSPAQQVPAGAPADPRDPNVDLTNQNQDDGGRSDAEAQVEHKTPGHKRHR